MWYYSENGDATRPDLVDDTSSRAYVYVRRNLTFVAESGEGEELRPAHWTYEEMKVPREVWPVYEQTMQNTANIDYLAMMTGIDIEEV